MLQAKSRYDAVAIAIHWLTAGAIAGQLVMGWTMTAMRPGAYLQYSLYQWHKSVGITILVLSLIRLAWRLMHKPPPLPAEMPAWEQRLARLSHAGLYVLLIALPLSGWAVVSVSPLNIPTMLYGIVPLPHLPVLPDLADRKAAEAVLKSVHHFAGWVFVALLAGHIGAALRHHFRLHDDVLVRMLPRTGTHA